MAALTSTPTPVQHMHIGIQHKRFTTRHDYRLWYISLGLSGNIAVSGYNYKSGRTFIDLYFGCHSDSRDKLKLIYSKEFEKYSNYLPNRYVSFLDKNGSELLVTCIGDKIEIIGTKNKVLRSCRVNGKTAGCLAVSEGEIFIGLSHTVIVFNSDLKETKKIMLKGMKDGDHPFDLQVIKDRVFVSTWYDGRVLSVGVYDDSNTTQYTDSTGKYVRAQSIAVSERLGLVSVLWDKSIPTEPESCVIIVYSLNENKSFLVFNVDSNVSRIRISDRDRMIITGSFNTGEIKMYDLDKLFSFEAMKRTLAYIVSPDECEELRKYFRITEEELSKRVGDEDKSMEEKEKTIKKMACLLTIIEKKGHLKPYNIDKLTDVVSSLGDKKYVSNLKGPIEGYELYCNIQLKYKDLKAERSARQKAWEDDRNELITKLEAANSKAEEHEKTLDDLQGELVRVKKQSEEQENTLMARRTESTKEIERLTEELEQTKQFFNLSRTESSSEIETLTAELNVTKQVLKETKQDRDITRTELKQYQLDFAKESNALKEVVNQTKEAMAELQKRTKENKPSVDSEETRDECVSALAAEYGRLTVAIAEHLNLDHCFKLAIVLNIPASDCDTVLRVSLIESPGIKFLDVLKKRKVINMFDVTNLQKGLAMLHLDSVNHYLVVPYQDGIDKEHYELNKAKEMFTWEEVDACRNSVKDDTAGRQAIESQTSLEDDTGPDNTSQTEATAQQSETWEEERRSLLRGRHHQLYIEHSIGREGGTIQLANVSLTVPPDALHESHVIALSVMNESPFPLDREVDTARMTPLIKLEPLGLMFKKSLQLNIPHSALILEQENHDVIIYSGQISKNIEDSSDSITWTQERSILRQLKEKSVTVDIQCLSYLSASLVSQTTAPSLYNVRVVPFLDGIRNSDDDITLTVCFCSDNDSEYNMLLRDYKTKLRLEQYSTLQLRRHSERGEEDAGFLSVTVTSVNNTYVPDAEQIVKKFTVSHLCTASRVSHQLRLNKNQETDRDVVDIMLTFSQAQYGPTKIILKARIKDLIISEEIEKLLTGSLPPAFKPYKDLKAKISLMLENDHCIKLATYFELSPAEAEKIQTDAAPGTILMKILDEREKIMPGKMIGLFEGLKTCHLDKIARMVLEYIKENSKETQQERSQQQERNVKGISEDASVSQHPSQKRQTLCSQSDKATVHLSAQTSLEWIKEHRGLMFYLLLMSVDGLLQTQRGVFTLPRWFKN